MEENVNLEAEVTTAEAPKKAPAKKPAAKKKTEAVVAAVVEDVEHLVTDAKKEVSKFEKELEGKTVDELRQLRTDALWAESELKRELHVLRLRAANMATTAEADVDQEIMDLKKKLSEAAEWLFAVEKKLEGEFKDLTEIRF